MFFPEPLPDLLFLVFSNMMIKKVIFGPPAKSTGLPKWLPKSHFSAKTGAPRERRCHFFTFWEPTRFQEAARSVPDLIFIDFGCILGAPGPHFSCFFMILAPVLDPKIANPGRHPRIKLIPKICQKSAKICQKSAKICQKLSETTKCAHTTLRI